MVGAGFTGIVPPVGAQRKQMKSWIGQGLLMSLVLATAGIAGADSTRYDRTIRALQAAEPEWRADFAGVALWQLTGAYYAEADLARQDSQPPTVTPVTERALQKKRHWSAVVDQYAGRLADVQRQVEAGAKVSFALSPVTEAMLQVADEQVMLAHPRPEQQAAFEQLVLEQFCQLRDCWVLTGWSEFADSRDLSVAADGAISALGDQSSIGMQQTSSTQASITPSWEFTAAGSACSYAGIRLRFQRDDNLGALRQLCRDLFGEVAAVRDGLWQQQQYGVEVEWSALAFSQPSVETGEPMLKLNRAGDLLRVDAPLLRGRTALLQALKPWLAAQVAQQNSTVELQAEAYGWRGAGLESYR